MTGAQLPLYVILHVITMLTFCCTASDDDMFSVQRVLPAAIEMSLNLRNTENCKYA